MSVKPEQNNVITYENDQNHQKSIRSSFNTARFHIRQRRFGANGADRIFRSRIRSNVSKTGKIRYLQSNLFHESRWQRGGTIDQRRGHLGGAEVVAGPAIHRLYSHQLPHGGAG